MGSVREASLSVGPAVRVGRAEASSYEVVEMPLDEYVAAVVAAEAPAGAPAAALEAVAVAARTFAELGRRRHQSEGFELCDLTHCQVVGRANDATRAAARATSGQVLFYGDRLAQVFYTGDCGGYSEVPSSVWPGSVDPPYLPSRPQRICRVSKPWTSSVTAGQIAVAMRAAGARGESARSLRVTARTASGRASMLEVVGFDPPAIRAEVFRAALGRTAGWQFLKSTAFEVRRVSSGFRFEGRGSGHGVGLCLVGAARMAAEGGTALEILEHYFPGTRLESFESAPALRVTASGEAAPGETRNAESKNRTQISLSLPSGAERERDAILVLAEAAVREISREAGAVVPGTLRLLFHPTVQAYSRATGSAWWTTGVSRGTQVDLLPPDVLRERGVLERTLRHEIAHVVTASRLKGRPLWVLEGAAMYFSGVLEERSERSRSQPRPRPYPSPSGASSRGCPSDDEITRSRSADAMRSAYDRAAACFQTELRKGKEWVDVGK